MVETLAETQDSLRQAIEHIPQGVAVFDRDLRLVTCNSRYGELLALPDGLLRAGTALYDMALFVARRGDLGAGDAISLAAQRVQTLTQSHTTVSQRLGAKGQVLEFHSSRLPDGGLVISFADVTARVDAETELASINQSLEGRVEERTAALIRVNSELEVARAKADAANRDKTRFFAAASHDLLQPLNAARLYTSTLVERAGGTGLDELAHSIEASLTAVEEIMAALLDISRIDAGAVKPAAMPFQVRDLLKKVDVEFAPLALKKEIELRLVDTSLAVVGDRALTARVIQNLVSNAIKYTPGGRVLIGVRRRGELCEIQVIDTGIGIPGDKLDTVFREFLRLEEGARVAEGLGLGLSIVDRIARVLRLELRLASAPGRGTRFSVLMPVTAMAEQTRGEETPERPAARTALAGMRVMCIDNDPRILDGMRLLLEGWGCRVLAHAGSRTAEAEESAPDIILADYHLDGETGLEAIERLRRRHGGDIPAVLITADRSNEVRAQAAAIDVPVIRKPVKPAALRAAITRLRGTVSAAAE